MTKKSLSVQFGTFLEEDFLGFKQHEKFLSIGFKTKQFSFRDEKSDVCDLLRMKLRQKPTRAGIKGLVKKLEA